MSIKPAHPSGIRTFRLAAGGCGGIIGPVPPPLSMSASIIEASVAPRYDG